MNVKTCKVYQSHIMFVDELSLSVHTLRTVVLQSHFFQDVKPHSVHIYTLLTAIRVSY
jgi:hypothetical protein